MSPAQFNFAVLVVGLTFLVIAAVVRYTVTLNRRWTVPSPVRICFIVGFPTLLLVSLAGIYTSIDLGQLPNSFSFGLFALAIALLVVGSNGKPSFRSPTEPGA